MSNDKTAGGAGRPLSDHLTETAVLLRPMVTSYLDSMMPELQKLAQSAAAHVAAQVIDGIAPHKVQIRINDNVVATLPRQHFLFEAVLKLLAAKDRYGMPLNIALFGPTGSGKTKMCIFAAKALGVELVLQPFNPHTTKSELLGYMDAAGKYVPSPFYLAFKNGLLFIADEFDAANPAIATCLNASVGNRMVTFPNGETLQAHQNFRAVFCMNTDGRGGDDQYTGRNRLDMATLDRLVYVHVPLDPGLEAHLVGVNRPSPTIDLIEGGQFKDNAEILDHVASVRTSMETNKLRYFLSPRATVHACAMHEAGFGKVWIDNCCIWRGIPQHVRQQVYSSLT
jgi:hypothetical protein